MLPKNFPSKLGAWDPDQGWIPITYNNCFQKQSISGVHRILIASSGSTIKLIQELIEFFPGPYRLAYLLVTPPDGFQQMKYETDGLDRSQVDRFLEAYGPFLEGDARHHVWIHSGHGTIIWDEHDWLYVYGSLESVEGYLMAQNFGEEMPVIPFPHLHNESPDNNQAMRDLLSHFDWQTQNVSNLG